jgi:hypothetical protein
MNDSEEAPEKCPLESGEDSGKEYTAEEIKKAYENHYSSQEGQE